MSRRRQICNSDRYLIEAAANEFYKHNRIKGLSEAAQKQYKIYIDQLIRWYGDNRYLDTVTEEVLEDFIEYKVESGNKMVSVATTMRHLRTFFKFCIQRGYMPEVKVTVPKFEKEIKIPYTLEEMNMLLVRPTSNSWVELRSWAMVTYFFSTGQRLSTVLNIKMTDLNLDEAIVRLDWNKDKIEKFMPLSTALVKTLRIYIQLSDLKDNEYLFPDCEGGKLNRRSAEGAIARYNRSRGVTKTSIHLFRHAFAKYYILNGGNAVKLQKLMNHKSLEQTMKYVRLYGHDIASDLDTFNPLDNIQKKTKENEKPQKRLKYYSIQ